jgi:threonyl-tRNA synthetase
MKSSENYEDSELYKIRHTAAHILAMAALELDPRVKLAIGPPIDNGFYYDFEFSRPVGDTDLAVLETFMEKIIKANYPVEHKTLPRAEAIAAAKKSRTRI